MNRLVVALCALAACRRPAAPPHEDAGVPIEPLVEASAPSASSSAAIVDAGEPAWVPSGTACRRAIARGASFQQVSDPALAQAILDGRPGAKSARDCRGDRVDFDHALTEAQRKSPRSVLASPPADDDDAGATGLVRIDRYDVRGARMAVYAAVAVSYGYYFSCRGFQAIVRLDPDEIVVEGVGEADLYGCDEKGSELRLAPLDGRVALLLPVSTGTGESGDYGSSWSVSLPDHGALRTVGEVRRARGAGNGSMATGEWFGNMDAALLDAGAFQVEETWRFVRYETDGTETIGATRKMVRTYTLTDAGLVGSPAGDPAR